ncbi:MAG: autotransporter outer membrane beta-barrel domain-containing protein [Porphyrobacter sp.]|nr:autotransporter outer membrane beta-barrel domain-containing protein [Porphyrobacter sp.]
MTRRSSFRRHSLLTAVALGPLCAVLAGPVQAQALLVDGTVHTTVGSETYASGTVGNTGTGELTIDGAGNQATFTATGNWVLNIGKVADSHGVVNVSNGGRLTVNQSGGAIRLGDLGSGEMNVTSGGVVNAQTIMLGYNNAQPPTAGSSGKLVVSGAGSAVNAALQVTVGNGGDSELEIKDGGSVTAASYVLVGNNSSKGTVTIRDGGSFSSGSFAIGNDGGAAHGIVNVLAGGSGEGGLVIGNLAGSTGELNVTGPGAVWHVGASSEMTIGKNGTGTMTISDGGLVDVVGQSTSHIGLYPNGDGTVTVTGADSRLRMDNQLVVGQFGTAALNVLDGGNVSARRGIVGADNGSTGVVQVSGTGSQWNMSEYLNVGGYFGEGTLKITDGGVVSNAKGTIAIAVGGFGTVTVDGAGSRWNNSDTLTVGTAGNGSLFVSNGGLVDVTSTAASSLGQTATGKGSATVTGAGSLLRTAGSLTIGDAGTGHLIVSDGGTLAADGVNLGRSATGSGTLTIGSAVGDAPVAAGVVDAPWIQFGDGKGRIEFNHSDVSGLYEFAAAVSGAGAVDVYAGTTVLTADNTYTGGTTIAAGTLQLGNGGTSGSITGDVSNDGVLAVNRSNGLNLDGMISGAGAVHQLGTGTTVLNGTNTYTGGTLIDDGAVQTSRDANLGDAAGGLTLDGGRLIVTSALDTARNTTLGAEGGTFETVSNSTVLTHNGVIDGTGALTVTGDGLSVLTGANAYTGGTIVDYGVLQVSSDANLGAATGGLTLDSGELRTTADMATARRTVLGTNGGTIETAAGTTLAHSGIISGDGAFTKTGAGTLTLSGSENVYTGPTTVSEGTLRAGAIDSLSASSSVTVASGGRLDLAGYGQKIGGLTNAGLVSMGSDTAAGTVLTVDGDYVGQGGTILFNTVLGDDDSATDRMHVKGDTSGDSKVKVKNAGGLGDYTTDGIKLIDIDGASNGQFALLGDYALDGRQVVVAGGAFAYTLEKNGLNDQNGDWYLRSDLKPQPPVVEPPVVEPPVVEPPVVEPPVVEPPVVEPPVVEPPVVEPPVVEPPVVEPPVVEPPVVEPPVVDPDPDPETPGVDPDPDTGGGKHPEGPGPQIYQAGAPIYEQYPQALQALNDLPTLRQRVGQHAWNADQGEAVRGSRVWGRVVGKVGETQPATSTTGARRSQEQALMQMGADFALSESDAGTLVGGINGRYGTSSTEVRSRFGDGKIETDVMGVGGTLTWYGNNGLYADAQAQYSWYNSDLTSDTAKRTLAKDNDGHGVAGSIEGGWKQKLNDELSLTPQAQLTYSQVGVGAFEDAFGADVSLEKSESLRGRLSVSLDRETSHTGTGGKRSSSHLYVQPNLHYEFLDGSAVSLAGATATDSATLATRDDRLSGGLAVGGTNSWNDGKVQVFGEVNADTSLKNPGDSYSVGGRVGVRFKW